MNAKEIASTACGVLAMATSVALGVFNYLPGAAIMFLLGGCLLLRGLEK